MKKFISYETNTIRFTFDEGVADYTFDITKASDAVRKEAAYVGFNHRLGDAAAISRTTENGFKVTEAMRRAAVARLGDYYMTGAQEWNMRGPGTAINPAIAKMAERLGIDYTEAARRGVDAMLDELMSK